MFPDTANLPIAGGALFGAVAYSVFSLFVTGPLVGERMTSKSGWAQMCVRQVTIEAERRDPPASRAPSLTCQGTLGVLYGGEGERFCHRHGHIFDLPFGGVEAIRRQTDELRQSRVAAAAAQAPDRCSCAAASVVENRRVDFALHTGSLRFVTPTPIKNLRAELSAALRSPVCAANAKE